MRKTLPVLCLLILLWSNSLASAHYLWVTTESQGGGHGRANIIFEEAPSAGDGRYLDHFANSSKTWFRTVTNIEAQLIQMSDTRDDKKRWLRTNLPAAAPRSVESYWKFGVYSYGKTKVLLHYYARHLDVQTHEQLHELGRAEQMDLDIVPHDVKDEFELTVLWKGKTVVEQTVYIRGPKRFRKNIQTDENGRVRFAPVNTGRYTFRTSVEEATPGQEGDEKYDLIRHHGTLIMKLPLQK